MLHAKNDQCGEAAFLYVPHSAVVSRFETALSLRPRSACRERRERPPPKPGGHVTFRRDMMLHVSTPAPWGRSRLHLSLREGSETAPLSPRASSCRIGPRRQGFASPLRALDGSGPIRKTRCLRGKRGGRAGERGAGESSRMVEESSGSLAHDKGYYHSSCRGERAEIFKGMGPLLNHVRGARRSSERMRR